ncbi:hypothetical protein, partial [Sandarakinorhabdus rubra]|uniref:hypothetical protein n=1 Tax=Sandarakinorhabdus rubra TaxID=2672568 RepID=UPI0013DBE709
ADVRHLVLNGAAHTPGSIVGRFAQPARNASRPLTLAAAPARVGDDHYWWHEASWVEESRGACCPDHAHSFAV